MLNPNTRLNISHTVGGSTDISIDMQDFTRNTLALNQTISEYIIVGLYKPFFSIDFDITTGNSNGSVTSLALEYWNGITWIAVDDSLDQTKQFTRSGRITWGLDDVTTWLTSLNNGETIYFIRIAPVGGTTADAVFNGMNIIFSNDQDLAEQVPEINDSTHLTGKVSHILAHVAARNWIVQSLRNKNYIKYDIDGTAQDITAWDLLDVNQINESSTFKALSLIYFNYSDEVGDNYSIKSKSFEKRAKTALELATLNIDVDDDGILDSTENAAEMKQRRVTR